MKNNMANNANAGGVSFDMQNDKFLWDASNPDSGTVHQNIMGDRSAVDGSPWHLIEQAVDSENSDYYVTFYNGQVGLELSKTDEGVTIDHWTVQPVDELFV